LIVTYKELGLKLEDCHIRRLIEERMNKIADGNLTKEQATRETLSEVTPIFEDLKNMEERWLKEMAEALEEHQSLKQIEMSTDIFERNQFPNNNNNNNSTNASNQYSNDHSESNITSIVCYGCKKPGHLLPNCPERQIQRQAPIRREAVNIAENDRNPI
jgi:hypothetical protein